jgi:hypothetical protein
MSSGLPDANHSIQQPDKVAGEFSATGLTLPLPTAVGSDPALLLAPVSGTETPLSGLGRGAKSSKPQPVEENKNAVAAAVPAAVQPTLVLPLRIQPFSLGFEKHEPFAGIQSSPKAASRHASGETSGKASAGDAALPAAAPVQVPFTPTPAQFAALPDPPAANPGGQTAKLRETPDPLTPQAPQSSVPGELAFAARVQPAPPANDAATLSQQTLQREVAAPAATPLKKPAESDAAGPTAVQPVAAQPGAGSPMTSYGFGHAAGSAEPTAPATPSPAAGETPAHSVEGKVAEAEPKPAAPLKDLSLQVAQPGAEKVEVRLTQQSGELRVAVRTGDSDLAHGLQQGLSDLVGRLQETGFRAEAWHPGAVAAPSANAFETPTSPGDSRNGDAQSQSGGSQQQPGERRQSQPQRPGWVEELEESIAGGKRS